MQPWCALVDWGTSSFRVWLIDGRGTVLAGRRSDEGMSTLSRPQYADVLETHLASLAAGSALPVVICGMAGSRQGWIEAPYIDVPAGLGDLAANAVAVPGTARDVRIVPGLAKRDRNAPDVMRGEDTQLLGALGAEAGAFTACMPGTHSKWVRLDSGAVTDFTTYMTGELYAAIRGHTILAQPLADDRFDESLFRRAVADALDGQPSLTSRLFAIRAGALLGYAEPGTGHSALSGLLIGTEIAAACAHGRPAGDVQLIAGGPLGERYATALEIAGLSFRRHDADKSVIAGLTAVANAVMAANPARKII